MLRSHWVLCLIGAIGLACWSTPAQAVPVVTYSYVTDNGSGGGNVIQTGTSVTVSGATNATITVNLYLQEALNGSSSIVAANGGLVGAGASLQRTSGDAGASITGNTAVYSGNFSITNNPIATGGTNSSLKDNFVESLPLGATQGAGATTTNASFNEFLIGSITLTVGSTSSAFTLTARNGGNGNTVTFNNSIGLDTDNGANSSGAGLATFNGARDVSFTINVNPLTSTPEPSSMLLCGLAMGGMGFGAWRRRKSKLLVAVVDAKA